MVVVIIRLNFVVFPFGSEISAERGPGEEVECGATLVYRIDVDYRGVFLHVLHSDMNNAEDLGRR